MVEILPIFPLSGALLLPHGRLPLNIFEPRYMAMVDAALKTNRLIGMIQPQADGAVYAVGCVGRITEFAETDDGRYLITLKGVNRFRYEGEEPLAAGGYRLARVDVTAYLTDKVQDETWCVDRAQLSAMLKKYFEKHDMKCAWEKIDEVVDHDLITCLAMVCPFTPQEQQALLEAYDECARMQLFMTMLDMGCRTPACGCLHKH